MITSGIGNHFLSIDQFTNPTNGETFCKKRQSRCKELTNCAECSCYQEQATFVSYMSGCKNLSSSSTLFGSKYILLIYFQNEGDNVEYRTLF